MIAVEDFLNKGNSFAVKVAILVQFTVIILMIWVVEKF